MPRKVTSSLQRKVMPDRKYQSVLVSRLINRSMLDGKKPSDMEIRFADEYFKKYIPERTALLDIKVPEGYEPIE